MYPEPATQAAHGVAGHQSLTSLHPVGSAVAAFEDCANDVYCAIRSVRGFLDHHVTDCTADEVLTCDDFALLHKAGSGNECLRSWPLKTSFWRDYQACARYLGL